MIDTYNKIKEKTKAQFSMPLSLQITKELKGYNYEKLHLADILSLLYSIRIDNANTYLEQKRQEKMQKRGINSITQASASDIEAL